MSDKEKVLKHFNPMKLREKYSAKNFSNNRGNNYSSFWLDNDWDRSSSFFDDEEEKPKGPDLIELAS